MLSLIVNSTKDMQLTRLNDKIKAYNKLATDAQSERALCLLCEISYIVMYLKSKRVDDAFNLPPQYPHLQPIEAYQDVTRELLKKGFGNHKESINFLLSRLDDARGLPTNEEWSQQITHSSILNTSKSKAGLDIMPQLRRLNQLRAKLSDNPKEKNYKDYYYNLKELQDDLLNRLAYQLDKKNDLTDYRILLARVNHELKKVMRKIPQVKAKEKKIKAFLRLDLSKDLAGLDDKKMDQLIVFLRNSNAIDPGSPQKSDIDSILPALKGFELVKLGGQNNRNWKIVNIEKGVEYVIQIGMCNNNVVLQQKSQTSISQYLATEYFSYQSSNYLECPYTLSVIDFANGGDLSTEMKDIFSKLSKEELVTHTVDRMKELTEICQNMLNNKVMHPDIKLSNFLIDENGAIVIADKKELKQILPNGKIYLSEIGTTSIYAPPENKLSKSEISAESFMVYQLGIALYDMLVSPEHSDNKKDIPWSQALDFKKDVFTSAPGMQFAFLIKNMTKPNSKERPTLQAVYQYLEAIQELQSLQQHTKHLSSQQRKVHHLLGRRKIEKTTHVSGERKQVKSIKKVESNSKISYFLSTVEQKLKGMDSVEEVNSYQKKIRTMPGYKMARHEAQKAGEKEKFDYAVKETFSSLKSELFKPTPSTKMR